MIVTIPLVKIEPNGLTITSQYYTDDDKNSHWRDIATTLFNDEPDIYSKFSTGSRSRLKRALNLLIAISKPQTFISPTTGKKCTFLLNFITLTLSAKQGIYTDHTIKEKCLNNFLTTLRRSKGLRHYLWRAEPQKNGNIHFHIATNQFFNWQYIRDTWNNVQKNLGFIDLFNEKHHHINPNSTDIHSVKDITRSGAYITKYLKKVEEDARRINGKVWDCSRSLKPKERCLIDIHGDDIKNLEEIETLFSERIFTHDYFKFIWMDKHDLQSALPDSWKNQYNNYLQSIINN